MRAESGEQRDVVGGKVRPGVFAAAGAELVELERGVLHHLERGRAEEGGAAVELHRVALLVHALVPEPRHLALPEAVVVVHLLHRRARASAPAHGARGRAARARAARAADLEDDDVGVELGDDLEQRLAPHVPAQVLGLCLREVPAAPRSAAVSARGKLRQARDDAVPLDPEKR